MTAIRDWNIDPANRDWLAKLLGDPQWKLAVAAVLESRRPRWDGQQAGADVLVTAAVNMHRLQGLNDFLDQLEVLTHEPPAPRGEKPDAFSEEYVMDYAKEHGWEFVPPKHFSVEEGNQNS